MTVSATLTNNKALTVVGEPRILLIRWRGVMGTIISFPESRRCHNSQANAERHGPAMIIILPVIRIERYVDEPTTRLTAGPPAPSRKRRRRTTRS